MKEPFHARDVQKKRSLAGWVTHAYRRPGRLDPSKRHPGRCVPHGRTVGSCTCNPRHAEWRRCEPERQKQACSVGVLQAIPALGLTQENNSCPNPRRIRIYDGRMANGGCPRAIPYRIDRNHGPFQRPVWL